MASKREELLSARKSIEHEMGRFNNYEKECKMKATTEAKHPNIDPEEKARSDTRDWVNFTIGRLKRQTEIFEDEKLRLERLTDNSEAEANKKLLRVNRLATSILRHDTHVLKLEQALRCLDNYQLSTDQVNRIKDTLEDYLVCNQASFDDYDNVNAVYRTLTVVNND